MIFIDIRLRIHPINYSILARFVEPYFTSVTMINVVLDFCLVALIPMLFCPQMRGFNFFLHAFFSAFSPPALILNGRRKGA